MDGGRRSAGRQRIYRRQAMLAWVFSALVALVLLAFVFFMWLKPLRVSGDSMEPALSDGEAVLCDRLGRYLRAPGRGDIVLFTDAAGGYHLKRIIGLPGETVELWDGRVFIDSRPLDERAYAVNIQGRSAPQLVPAGCVYVLGDNRALVYDSRLPEIGCVRLNEIAGVLRFRIRPISRFTLFY